jgi:hypothetical protein
LGIDLAGTTSNGLSARVGIRYRRGRALPVNIGLWALVWGAVVFVLHALSAGYGRSIGAYWSGSISLAGFIAIAWYAVRKRNVWFSVRLLRATGRVLPRPVQQLLIYLDRLESWRAYHVSAGILVLVPLWWHLDTGLMSPLEAVLMAAVALLILTGIAGVYVQDALPHAMTLRAEHQVRLMDVDAKINAIYVEAEEKILGHQEQLVQTYLRELRPILIGSQSKLTLLRATLTSTDPGSAACTQASAHAERLGDEAPLYRELLALAQRKINLEHNAFNLRLSMGWLRYHVGISIVTFVLIAFHVAAVMYFAGR